MKTIENPRADYNWDYRQRAPASRATRTRLHDVVPDLWARHQQLPEWPSVRFPTRPRRTSPALGIRCTPPHNAYIEAGAETGIPGGILWIVMVPGGVIWLLRLRRRIPPSWANGDPEQRFLYFCTLYFAVLLVGYSAGSFFLSFTWYDVTYYIFALLAALQVAVTEKLRRTLGGAVSRMPSVLVTDGDERAALAVVRSLGRAGYRVHVCGSKRRTLASVSRHAAAAFAAPDPLRAPHDFVAAVAAYVRTHAIDVILPIAEPALLAVLDARPCFGAAAIPFPSIETFRAASDKAALMGVASELGLAVPRQWELATSDALAHLDVSALPYPVVIKPGRSVGEHDGVRSKQGVRYASSPAELRARVAAMSPAAFPLLVQERVIGTGSGVFLLRWEGAIIASFAHRRIREKPPAGGVSVYAEAVPVDGTLREHSERLLDRLGWEGVAMIEYKIDTRTGAPYLMEINGRFWGSLQLAIDAGIDFPLLLVRLATGESVMPQHVYREGTSGRWWWGEVDHVLARLRRSETELALPPGSPTRGDCRSGLSRPVAPSRARRRVSVRRPDAFCLRICPMGRPTVKAVGARWARRRLARS